MLLPLLAGMKVLMTSLMAARVCCCGGQLKKMTDRVEKNRKEVEATRGKYDAALSDLNAYNAKYMEDMTEVCSYMTVHAL